MNKITQVVHRYIVDYTLDHGHTPNYAQIMKGADISSKSVVYRHVKELEKDYIVYRHDGILMIRGFKRSIAL